MTEASFVRDCLPEPPTPTSKPEPQGILRMRQIRDRCSSAYLKMFTHKNMPFIRVKVGVENGGDGYVAANEIGIT